VEQPEYNVFTRNKVEYEFVDLYSKYKLGLTTWSPLAFGMLTGKYSAALCRPSLASRPRRSRCSRSCPALRSAWRR